MACQLQDRAGFLSHVASVLRNRRGAIFAALFLLSGGSYSYYVKKLAAKQLRVRQM
jgi:hypothetical protein